MFGLTLLLLALLPLQGPSSWVKDADDGVRVIVDTNVKCDHSNVPASSYIVPVGMPIRIIQEVKADGSTWYVAYPGMAPNSSCRVYGPSTAVWHKSDPDSLVLAILDHILARKDVGFDEFVEIENYLIDIDPRWKSDSGRKQISGLLQFRWLQLLSRAVRANGFNPENTLIEFWILNHGELLAEFGPSEEWYVPPNYFWQLFDSNKTSTWSEELAWFVANLPVQHDECEDVCILGAYVENRFLQYWTRFPSGPHISEALAHAGEKIRGVVGGECESKDELKLVAAIRASLSKVTHPSKQEILKSLAEIEHKCAK